MRVSRLAPAVLLACLGTTAAAVPVVDQQSPYGKDVIIIGVDGTRNINVGQTVTAGLNGDLMRLELGIACDGGALIIEIVNLAPGRSVPGTDVRSGLTVDAASLSGEPVLRTFDLGTRPSMSAGDPFAIVLRNESGTCKALKGPTAIDGSSYVDGNGFLQRSDALPDAWINFLDAGTTGDIGFKTIVNVVYDSPPCTVNGFATPFPGWLPVCRCISDEGLNDFRCALLHRSYFLFRNIPASLEPGEKFEVKWTLVVYAPMKGVVEVTDHLPPGFTGSPKAPLTFFVEQVPVGQSLTLSYPAVAPLKPGRYKVLTGVDGGTMQTFIEVVR